MFIDKKRHTYTMPESINIKLFPIQLGKKKNRYFLCLYKNKYYVKLFTSFNRKGGTFLFKLIKSLHIHYPSALLYLRICKILIRRVWFDYNNYNMNAFSFIGNMKGHGQNSESFLNLISPRGKKFLYHRIISSLRIMNLFSNIDFFSIIIFINFPLFFFLI